MGGEQGQGEFAISPNFKSGKLKDVETWRS